ncbi:nucleotide exchange factor GrpE [Lentisalinibacter orientalis]|uniref:nucleotide exchange factor GrpE n=1 Tax=Lentisalinibacter orientalis TaxID=2992241 RepID=UPI00386FF09C
MSNDPERSDDPVREDEPGEPADEFAETQVLEGEGRAGVDEDPLEAERRRADENWEKYLRAVAELENFRKRAARDLDNTRKYAIERFAGELLGVADSLEMGIAAGEAADAASLLEGKQATLKQLRKVLGDFGVEEIDPRGERFDPEYHEAMTMQPSAEAEPGSVLTVVQKGYRINGRLLRPARVIVAAEPQSGEG